MDHHGLYMRAFEARQELFDLSDTDCFRLFNSAGDGFEGVTIDRYGDYVLIQLFDEARFNDRAGVVRDIIPALERIPLTIRGVLLKDRTLRRGNLDYTVVRRSVVIEGDAPPGNHVVRQNGLLASVDLVEGVNTGIFLDMREIRSRLAPAYPRGGAMLNLFSYTAMFSVQALACGMARSLNIDLSRAVLARAKANYALNDIPCDDRDFVCGDALQWMKRLEKRKEDYSFIVFDPPTFSRNRKKSFSVKQHYADALGIAVRLCMDGLVFTAINSHSVSQEEYRACHPGTWEPLFFAGESSDFPSQGRPYLKAGLWKSPGGR
jgi:23S rRNA (cytosine1962-C5)-methyltransferase